MIHPLAVVIEQREGLMAEADPGEVLLIHWGDDAGACGTHTAGGCRRPDPSRQFVAHLVAEGLSECDPRTVKQLESAKAKLTAKLVDLRACA
jgi:hypothetical protein